MVTEIGKNPLARYCAYGDDSAYKDILVYAYVVFHRQHIDKAIRRINRIKRKFRISEEIPLHCRLLFSGKQRQKLGLKHLSPRDVQRLVSNTIERINSIPCWLKYSYCHIDELVEDVELLPGQTDIKFHYEPKAILGILSQSCFAPSGDKHEPLAEEIEIFTSKDATKVKFMDNKRATADKLTSGFNRYATNPPNNDVKIVPHIMEHDHPLQQIADIYVYTCAHALSKKHSIDFFKKQLSSITYWTRSEFSNDRSKLKMT